MERTILDQFAEQIHSVKIRNKILPLTYTGVKNGGGFTAAFEFENSETKEKYYIKFTEVRDDSSNEVAVLTKAAQLFRNEVLIEPDPLKRMNYVPVPEILTDDPENFNLEFIRIFDRGRYHIQIQTSGEGDHCETKLPDQLQGRIAIALQFAKLLRTCAKNKIAYVDVKPLEHLFWIEKENRVQITLIDWGISRANASVFLLSEDLRKFCLYLPEIIYGRKMLELTNKGKFEYPIQKENDSILIRMLGRLSFAANLPPLSQKYAVLVGEQLSGAVSEIRIQNRCVEVWDEVIDVLDTAYDASKTKSVIMSDWESLKKKAEELIQKEGEMFLGKDFFKIMESRLTSLASYPSWLIPEIRFIQTWFGKIDFVPHRGFDLCVQCCINDQPQQFELEFNKISELILAKLEKNTSNPELTALLKENIEQVRHVIQAWIIIHDLNNGNLSDEDFHIKFSSSVLRVIDPILADAYKKKTRQNREKKTNILPPDAEFNENLSGDADVATRLSSKLETKPDLANRIYTLVASFGSSDLASDRWGFGFIQELDSILQITQETKAYAEEKQLEPILESMVQEIQEWTEKIGPQTFIAADEVLHHVNWITTLPQNILNSKIIKRTEKIEIGSKIKNELDQCIQKLTEAGVVVSQEVFDRISDKLIRIKGLRKKLDSDNLFRLRNMIENGDYKNANQIIDEHYMENPPLYDRIREEILSRQKDDEDKKSIALINAVLTDLSGNSDYSETGKYLKNQQNVPIVQQKIYEFRQKNIQLFDIQDELIRTKSIAHDSKKSLFGVKQNTGIILFLLILVILFSIGTLTVILAKNFSVARNIAKVEKNLNSFQETYLAYANATDLPTMTAIPVTPTVPAATPTSTVIPTVIPTADISVGSVTSVALSPADEHLQALVGKKVLFDLNGNVSLFADEAMTPERQLGTVINFVQGMNGVLVNYNDKAVHLQSTFNIGRSQISISTYKNVSRSTNIRMFSDVPSATTPVFISQIEFVLVEPASACTSGNQEFCHGLISFWVSRDQIESSIK